jgi:hypothetical protein
MGLVMCVYTGNVGGYCYNRNIQKKEKLMPSEARKYTLVEYTFGGQRVVSAIHHLDLMKFLIENKDARIIKK